MCDIERTSEGREDQQNLEYALMIKRNIKNNFSTESDRNDM